MEAVILFGFILVILGVAFAVPMASLRGRMVADRDASVLGASILVLGMGSLNYGFLAWFVITGEMEELLLIVGLAPLVAGGLGLLVTRKRLPGIIRSTVLLASGGLTVAGLPGYFAFNVALLLVVVAVLAFVSGLLSDPRSLARRLDPRL
jgi:hypothetical protein